MSVDKLLAAAIKLKGSDLHLSAGLKPMIRKNGELRALEYPELTTELVESMLGNILCESLMQKLKSIGQLDFAYEIPGIGRFRGNAFNQARGMSVAFRAIPAEIIPIEKLGVPEAIRDQCLKRSGMILVTGPTGSGKSTTLAGIIDLINQTKRAHILTIEDPIEFVHTSQKSLIHQRQIGEHSSDFASALRAALREDPDVIMVGEMRDLETIELALTAAETGHMVFGTLHTRNAAKTIDRMISVFPSTQQNQVKAMAAESLRAIISQNLLPKADNSGMIAAFEILIMTPGIRNLIRESKIYQIPSAIQTGARLGMISMEQSIKKMALEKIISAETAAEIIPAKSIQKPDLTPGVQSSTQTKPGIPQNRPPAKKGFRFSKK